MRDREREQLWLLVFRCRDVFILAVSLVALLSPFAGDRRFLIAGTLVAVVLPYNAWLRHRTQRRGEVPTLMAFGDPALCAVIALAFPEALAATMVAAEMDLAIAAATFRRRVALQSALFGAAAFSAVATIDVIQGRPVGDAALATPAYAVAAVTTALMVSALVRSEWVARRQFGTVVEGLQVVAFEMEAATGQILQVSPNVEQVLGHPPQHWLRNVDAVRRSLLPADRPGVAATVRQVARHGGSAEVEYRFVCADGRVRWAHTWLIGEPDDAHADRVRGILVDVTERKALEEQLTRQALHDDLTGLPNRVLLLDRAAQALAGLGRSGGCVAVVFGDLALFKRVNDSLGHAAGDALLTAFGERLRDLVRPEDTIARFGGDEFVVLATLGSAVEVPALVERLLTAFDRDFAVQGRDLPLAGRFGAVATEDPGADPAQLLLAANAAMHSAKQAGRPWALYDPEMHRRERERATLETELGGAVQAGQLRLLYQPIVRATTSELVAVEALLRWQHPDRGLLAPGEFLELAEATGQVLDLGRWALQEGCRQLATWRALGLDTLTLNVNLSARQLADPALVDTVLEALRAADVPAERLCLEITETALIADPRTAAEVLTELWQAGVRLALDDFGTGYSSLTHLRRFPVTTLKVDRSFASGVLGSVGDVGIVRSIVGMAHNLGLGVVAEGVETPEQAAQLTSLGCGYLQGYLVSRPVPAEDVPRLATPVTTVR